VVSANLAGRDLGSAARDIQAALAGLELVADTYLSVGAAVQGALADLFELGAAIRAAIAARVAANRDALAGALVALPEAAITAQFGATGKRLWQLAAGRVVEPVTGRIAPEPIRAALSFFTPVGERELLAHALDQLIARALKHPRRIGWRIHALRARAEIEGGGSWLTAHLLKEPTADAGRIAAPLKTRLEQAPPTGAVERLVLEFTGFAPGTTELQLFARDAQAAARAGQQRALRSAAREIRMRVKRAVLYHIIEVQPWSRLPERRYALIDYEP